MFATRVNGYVKIRGVRVSLPEIEDVLRAIRRSRTWWWWITPAERTTRRRSVPCI